jgi:hypothetical protein
LTQIVPARLIAGSKHQIRFDAAITTTPVFASNQTISVKIWFNVCLFIITTTRYFLNKMNHLSSIK